MNIRKSGLVLLTLAALIGGASTTSAQDIQERTIRFGHLNNTDHPMSIGAQKFAELVKEKSGGKLNVREFPANQLGSEMQQQAALQGGVQEMTAPAPTSLAGIVKEFGMLDFPFIVSSFEQADALLDGPVGDMLLAKLPEHGLVGLAFWDLGFRNVTNSRRPITRGEDLEGLRLRVIPNPVFLETFNTFKANPVPMSFSELYQALESRAVDGQENPFSVILSNKFFEVQEYLSQTNHVYASNIILVSKRFWDRLSPAEQNILQESAIEARDYQRTISRDMADKALAGLRDNGMKINQLEPAELARMQELVRPIYDRFSAEYDPEMVSIFQAELERIHAQ